MNLRQFYCLALALALASGGFQQYQSVKAGTDAASELDVLDLHAVMAEIVESVDPLAEDAVDIRDLQRLLAKTDRANSRDDEKQDIPCPDSNLPQTRLTLNLAALGSEVKIIEAVVPYAVKTASMLESYRSLPPSPERHHYLHAPHAPPA